MPSDDPASACPVDPKAREAWMQAAGSQQPPLAGTTTQTVAPHPLPPQYANATQDEMAAACPVDPKAREAWLKAAGGGGGSSSTTSQMASQPHPPRPRFASSRPLSTHREVSSIPRGGLDTPAPPSTPPATLLSSSVPATATGAAITTPTSLSSPSPIPSPTTQASPLAHGVAVPRQSSSSSSSPNSESASDPHTSPSGHWIYPSEQMFFAAMKRKAYNPRAEDMASIIPIHNAVNERTWADILAWERRADPSAWRRCGGPKLVSFAGDSGRLTPRARWRTLAGYQAPFDRHDWVVERCGGERVEYVIDFYQGKSGGGNGGEGDKSGGGGGGGAAARGTAQQQQPLSFYLDARPKLNSVEGVRMRLARFWGFG